MTWGFRGMWPEWIIAFCAERNAGRLPSFIFDIGPEI
jgi:hypothetical protein